MFPELKTCGSRALIQPVEHLNPTRSHLSDRVGIQKYSTKISATIQKFDYTQTVNTYSTMQGKKKL